MRAVVQRVSQASITVGGSVVAAIDEGIAALIGFSRGDGAADMEYLARKITGLRIFGDAEGKMNLSLAETGGALLLVPQFTLYGDARKGRRPSWSSAMEPADASRLFEEFTALCRSLHPVVRSGIFGADMRFELANEGPVTILLDSSGLF
jgi:D-tyrosyl-tRNA(Tyr) deacylase